jgi:hypothetical protein
MGASAHGAMPNGALQNNRGAAGRMNLGSGSHHILGNRCQPQQLPNLKMPEYSILGQVTRADVRHDPYPHMVIDNCLPAGVYEELARTYPADSAILQLGSNSGNRSVRQNSRQDLHAQSILARPDCFSEIWRTFVEYHISNAFFQEFLRLMGPEITAVYPRLEQRLGCPLPEITTGVLGDTRYRGSQLLLDCHVGINTPATRLSSVRRVHTDAPDELFAALFYFRKDEDTAPGGDLEIHRWKDKKKPLFVASEVDESDTERVHTVPYRANTAVILINSERALHAVSSRGPALSSRRLVNVMGRFRESLPEGLFEKRQKMTPWALGRRALQRYRIGTGRL